MNNGWLATIGFERPWLRAPYSELTDDIQRVYNQVKAFASDVHTAHIKPRRRSVFDTSSRLASVGRRLVRCLSRMRLHRELAGFPELHFIDNTDPDGIDRTLALLGDHLNETLCIVTSKSGGTPETRNGMLVVAEAYQGWAALSFARRRDHDAGSKLDQHATTEGWLSRFAMFDWIGGRTSEMSVVGLLPRRAGGDRHRCHARGCGAYAMRPHASTV